MSCAAVTDRSVRIAASSHPNASTVLRFARLDNVTNNVPAAQFAIALSLAISTWHGAGQRLDHICLAARGDSSGRTQRLQRLTFSNCAAWRPSDSGPLVIREPPYTVGQRGRDENLLSISADRASRRRRRSTASRSPGAYRAPFGSKLLTCRSYLRKNPLLQVMKRA